MRSQVDQRLAPVRLAGNFRVGRPLAFDGAGAAPIVKRLPPDVDGAIAAGAVKVEDAVCPKPVLGAPNPVAGSPAFTPAGEAG